MSLFCPSKRVLHFWLANVLFIHPTAAAAAKPSIPEKPTCGGGGDVCVYLGPIHFDGNSNSSHMQYPPFWHVTWTGRPPAVTHL